MGWSERNIKEEPRMKKRLVTLLLALTLVLSLLPATAWAVIYETGFGAEGTRFHYNTDTKIMTIYGDGIIPYRTFSSVYSTWGFPISEVEKVVIESGVTEIGNSAFRDFTNLTSVTIPNTVTHIGDYAFYRCRSLTSVTLPNSLRTIDDFAFYECYGLTSVTFPSNVTEVGRHAFSLCKSLQSVTFQGAFTTIDEHAFSACSSLTSVTFPRTAGSWASISTMAFHSAPLKSLVIPEGVTSIANGAFRDCTQLQSVTFPSTLQYLDGSFPFCRALESITFTGDAPTIAGGTFIDVTATVYYPAGNDTWTADVMQNYGGNLTWVAVCSGDHTLGEWTSADETTHKRACTYCDYEETADHGWDEGSVTTAPTCQATGEALFTCAVCAATRTETLPLGDHPYNEWTKVDENTHTHACTVCGTEETVGHTWDEGSVITAANCIAGGETLYTCTGCGVTRNEAVAMTGIHTYDHGCDKDCNVCAATRTTEHRYADDWTSGKAGHWHTCVNCGAKGTVADHVPGPEATEETAQLCTVCDYILHPTLQHEHDYAAALTGDDTGHWYACASCSEQKDFAAHAFDNNCDTKCGACGYERITEHQWSDAWSHDETGHFHTCTVCGAEKDDAAHDFRRGVCTVCAAEDPNYEPPTVPIVIGAAVCVAAVAAIFVLRGKRKKPPRNLNRIHSMQHEVIP